MSDVGQIDTVALKRAVQPSIIRDRIARLCAVVRLAIPRISVARSSSLTITSALVDPSPARPSAI
jgi:hypothetical protein